MYPRACSRSVGSTTTIRSIPRALLGAIGTLVKPRTPSRSPASSNVSIKAQEAERTVRAAFKESKTIFEVVTGAIHFHVLEIRIENLLVERHRELFIIAASAGADLKQAEKKRADLAKAGMWFEFYGEEHEVLRQRSKA
ncbi:hypothetical protein AC579_2934 [Pseudocercospora musae]|uniref:Uncharacterized protein n=1 Tax=Pseudocercospora musae TaxID=113226 RepID=A0A139ITX5_9PEZI|nr:hypothetical protein AC579_2934 [Pseudocercospora musae]